MSNVRIAYDTFQKTAPGARDALLAMGKTADDSGFDKEIVELAKLRVSQINNCAFCLQIHLNVSRKRRAAGEARPGGCPGTRPASSPTRNARRWLGLRP
jgi:AhpD family alkylhydroperoxidase